MSVTAYDLARDIVAELDSSPDAIEVNSFAEADVALTNEAVRLIERLIQEALRTKGLIP